MPSHSDLKYVRGNPYPIDTVAPSPGMARLFARSGWTQQELADVEGKSQQWIVQRLTFGSFLNWLDTTAVVIDQNKRT